MNEYPNSIRNNMVSPEYKIDITSLPERGMRYKPQKEESHKLRNAVIAAALAAATLAGVAGVTYSQHQSMEQNTAVVSTEALPGGGTLNVTENPSFSYIVTPNGDRVSNYNGINAQELAQSYQTSGMSMGR